VYGHTVEIMGQVAMDLARTSRKSGGTAVRDSGKHIAAYVRT
jgi:hypothetical protein